MSEIALDIPGEKSDLYPITFQKIKALDIVISDKLMALKMFSARWKLQTTNYYGKEIHYEGILFEGTPEIVFWDNFIEPFLENGVIDILNATYQMCAEKNLEPHTYINEACDILKRLNQKTYKTMSRTDQILRGNGYPDSVTPKNVDDKIKNMDSFIDTHSAAILKRGEKPKDKSSEDVIDIKPNFFGIGLNLNALWRKLMRYLTCRCT